jgi:hypothetical protein
MLVILGEDFFSILIFCFLFFLVGLWTDSNFNCLSLLDITSHPRLAKMNKGMGK